MDEKLTYYSLEKLGRDKIIETIRERILEDGRIIIALAFGSILRRDKVRDIDIAVHASPEIDLFGLLTLGSKLEDSVGIPIDVSPLTEIAPCMRYQVIARGIRIVVRDERLLNEMMSASFSECQELKLLVAHHQGNG